MRRITTLMFVVGLCLTFGNAQPKGANGFICIGGKSFTAGGLAEHVLSDYKTVTYDARFSVKAGMATNIRIVHVDSVDVPFPYQILDEATKTNFSRITFLRDTAEARIRMTYVFVSAMDVSGNYAEVISQNEVRLVFRHVFGSCILFAIRTETRDDSVTRLTTLATADSIAAPTDILVERIFAVKSDTSIIVRNNNPWLNAKILRDANGYTLDDLRGENPDAKHFFIRYFLTRLTWDDCGVRSKDY